MLEQEWFTLAELAQMALPGVPATRQGMQALAEQREWTAPEREGVTWRKRAARGGGVEFHYSALWPPAQAALVATQSAQSAQRQMGARDDRWDWYERQPKPKRERAERRLAALDAALALQRGGSGKVAAMQAVAVQRGVRLSTLYAWEARTAGVPRADWLPFLADGWAGASERVECPAEAWDLLRSDWLRPEQPTFEDCFRRVQAIAAERGWKLPSKRTLERRLEAIPESVRVAARQGTEALKKLYPAQERSRAHFHALEAVNADGHKWDVFVRWPDGEIVRPMMLAWQDLYSGKLLSWRVDKTENKESTRLSFGDLVEEYGIPDKAWLDNGRQFASKWITGGSPNRYRFKVREEEPLGLLTQLGVEVHWTTPYSGQSKPIERMFRDFASGVARHPAFAGAYVGNNPMAKPENYGSAAVPLETFLRVVGEAVAEHNARPGRQSAVCNGRSLDAAFAESYATAPIRRASPAQRRLWLLAAENVLCAPADGSITLLGNRFWAEFLVEHRGCRVAARFDPQAVQADLAVYRTDGSLLGIAKCLEAVGFDDIDAAREHARARKAWMRGQKIALEAERKLSARDVAAMLPAPAAPAAPPERKVIRPTFGATALQPREADLPEQSEDEARMIRAMTKNTLRIVRTAED